MNNKNIKKGNPSHAINKEIPIRKAYSTPRLVCYGDLNELTLEQGSEEPFTDIVWGFGTGYKQPHAPE